MLHLKCLTVFWTCLCLYNSSVICTVTLYFVLPQTHSEFWHIQHSVFFSIAYSIIFSIIKAYSLILRHYQGMLRNVQAYAGIFSTLCNTCIFTTFPYSEPCHIKIAGFLKTMWNVDQAYSEPCHGALFSHIQVYSEPCARLS